jgi:prevent-host-death family protein
MGEVRRTVMNQHRMKQFNVAEAKAKFSELVDAAARGDASIIAKSGTPVAMLVPLDYDKRRVPIKFGTYKGKMVIPDDFDAPDGDIADMFENSGPLFPGSKK